MGQVRIAPNSRDLREIIPLDPTLVKGFHGRDKVDDSEKSSIIGSSAEVETAQDIHSATLSQFSQ